VLDLKRQASACTLTQRSRISFIAGFGYILLESAHSFCRRFVCRWFCATLSRVPHGAGTIFALINFPADWPFRNSEDMFSPLPGAVHVRKKYRNMLEGLPPGRGIDDR